MDIASEGPRLVGLGPAAGQLISLDSERVRLGRSEDNEVVIDLTQVSRTHARFEREANIWRVVDLDSTNGTRVDVIELRPFLPHNLRDGEVIDLGGAAQFQFFSGEEDPHPPTVRRAVTKTVRLTRTEAEVLELLFVHYDRGRATPRLASVQEIAKERFTSTGAVKTVLSQLYDKFELIEPDRNKEALAIRAQQWDATRRRH